MNVQVRRSERAARAGTERCDLCGRPIRSGRGITIVVPDSSYLHPTDPARDGRREALTCTSMHAGELVDRGMRSWVDEQLWSAKLRRLTGSWNRTPFTLDEIAALAGLAPNQLRRALKWQWRYGAERGSYGHG